MGKRGEPVFCVCRRPDDGSVMIQCNYCDEWYRRAFADEINAFKVPHCVRGDCGCDAGHVERVLLSGLCAEKGCGTAGAEETEEWDDQCGRPVIMRGRGEGAEDGGRGLSERSDAVF